MSLSYSFLGRGGFAFGGDLALGKRAGPGPNLSGETTSAPALRKLRLSKHLEHLLHEGLTLLVGAGIGESGQKGVDRVLRLREAELARIQSERAGGLIDIPAREVIGGHAEHQFLFRHRRG